MQLLLINIFIFFSIFNKSFSKELNPDCRDGILSFYNSVLEGISKKYIEFENGENYHYFKDNNTNTLLQIEQIDTNTISNTFHYKTLFEYDLDDELRTYKETWFNSRWDRKVYKIVDPHIGLNLMFGNKGPDPDIIRVKYDVEMQVVCEESKEGVSFRLVPRLLSFHFWTEVDGKHSYYFNPDGTLSR